MMNNHKKINLNFIDLFGKLDSLAERYNVTTVEWAANSAMAQPRITELRNAYKVYALNVPVKIGTHCSFERIYALLIGLRKILGDDVIDRELWEEAKKETDKNRKIMLLSLIIATSSETKKDLAIEGMKKLIQYNENA